MNQKRINRLLKQLNKYEHRNLHITNLKYFLEHKLDFLVNGVKSYRDDSYYEEQIYECQDKVKQEGQIKGLFYILWQDVPKNEKSTEEIEFLIEEGNLDSLTDFELDFYMEKYSGRYNRAVEKEAKAERKSVKKHYAEQMVRFEKILTELV